MGKFLIECPECHLFAKASTGFFASKRVKCACGNVIDVKAERLVGVSCPNCGTALVHDQADGFGEKCPVCGEALITKESLSSYISFDCGVCGCRLQAKKDALSVTCPLCDSKNDVQKQLSLIRQRESERDSTIYFNGDEPYLVWKHPNTDFYSGTRLIVHEGQQAVFFRNGKALDAFAPGQYVLGAGLLPRYRSLYSESDDSQPFSAEIYFVNMTTRFALKWGTSSRVRIKDPATDIPLEIGASGGFSLRVTDPRALLVNVVGTGDDLGSETLLGGDMGYFRGLVLAKVKSCIARTIRENGISALELDENAELLSGALKKAVNAELAPYGLTLPEFYINNIALPDDDPNFARLKQQHAEAYLNPREEKIKKAEAEAARERKAVENAILSDERLAGARDEAEILRIKAAAEAEAMKLKAEAEAHGMRAKGYSYADETARINGLKNVEPPKPLWDCACGNRGVSSAFCPECGARRPEPKSVWNCPECGKTGLTGLFCPECGTRRPADALWDCPECGTKRLSAPFCPNCGHRKAR